MVSCGYFHSAAISEKGELFTWGHNPDTRLAQKIEYKGNRKNNLSDVAKNILKPRLCKDLEHLFITQVSCGTSHSLMLDKEGRMYSAGSPEHG